jgi:L-rhamnonate dehydratase
MEIESVYTVEPPETPAPDYDEDLVRREAWTADARIANPMTRFPRYAENRGDWTPGFAGYGVVVEAADGTMGYAAGGGGTPAAVVVDEHLGPRIEGEPCMAIEKIHDMTTRMCSPVGAEGLASFAVSAIDLALWDLKGKLLDRPVYELLGGPSKDELPCYATGNDTDWYVELGFEANKLACPYGPADGTEGLRKNEELVAAARETLGPDRDLMLDCYMAFDAEYAVRLGERLAEYDLRWMEEYLRPGERDAHASVRERLPRQGLATGEHWFTVKPFQQAIADDLVDVLQPDIPWVGGLTALKQIVAMADAWGKTVIPHGGGVRPYGQHAVKAFPQIPLAEVVIGTPPGVPLEATNTTPGLATPEDGTIDVNDDPGFGVDVDPATLDRRA